MTAGSDGRAPRTRCIDVRDAHDCPWCAAPLAGHAELTAPDGVTVANDCPRCGRYVMPAAVVPLLADLPAARYWAIRAVLESAGLNAAAGPTTLTPALVRGGR